MRAAPAQRVGGGRGSFFLSLFSLSLLSLCSAFLHSPRVASLLSISFGLWRLLFAAWFSIGEDEAEPRRDEGIGVVAGTHWSGSHIEGGHLGGGNGTTRRQARRAGAWEWGYGGRCSRLYAHSQRQGQPGPRRVARHRAKSRGGQGRSKPNPMPPPTRDVAHVVWSAWLCFRDQKIIHANAAGHGYARPPPTAFRQASAEHGGYCLPSGVSEMLVGWP